MSGHPPIGACCSRPKFNIVSGVDGERTSGLYGVAGFLAALVVIYAHALVLH